jgi:cell division protein ZapB
VTFGVTLGLAAPPLAHGRTRPLQCGIARSILALMNETNPKSAVELELKRLEKRLEDLIATVAQIKEENRALRQRQETLTAERASLLQKNEQVRGRVEAMIGRLKSMEQA